MGRGADRDDRVDRLLAGAFEDRPTAGRWLVAGVLPRVEEALRAGGAELARWRRFAIGSEPGAPAPSGDGYDGAVVRLPRGSGATELALHLVAARLVPDGELWLGGANDEGIRSAERRLADVMAEVGEGTPGGHGRRVRARRPRPALRGELEAWAEPVSMALDGRVQELVGWPGLFAHGHLDPGTELLLAHLPDLRGASVLDFACGAGVIARVAAERGAARVDASDHDALAIHATRRNAPAATTWCVEGLPPGAWDRILSNPPLHRGVEQDYGALEGFAAALPRALRPGGAAWLVAQATVPIRRIFAGFTVAKVGADARYVVWRVAR